MSAAAAIVVGSPAWSKLEREVKEGKVTQAQLNQDLAGAQAPTGTAAPAGSTAPSPAEAAKNAGSSSILANIGTLPQLGSLQGAAETGIDTIEGVLPSSVSDAGNAVVEGIIGAVKPVATKLTLYGVLILGAVAMMILGLSEMLKPVGGPDVAGAAKRLAGAGGEVAAA